MHVDSMCSNARVCSVGLQSEEPLIRSIMGKTASAVAESARKAAGYHRRGKGLTRVHVKLVNPQVKTSLDRVVWCRYALLQPVCRVLDYISL